MDGVELMLFERQVEALEAIAEHLKSVAQADINLRERVEVLETLMAPAPPRPGRRKGE